jgi:hypothetical protein
VATCIVEQIRERERSAAEQESMDEILSRKQRISHQYALHKKFTTDTAGNTDLHGSKESMKIIFNKSVLSVFICGEICFCARLISS